MILTKTDTDKMRGVAILLIMLHNYFHFLDGSMGENQFTFDPGKFPSLLNLLIDHPSEIIKQFFVYFGHYGVALFFFFSAYGLTIKYKNSKIEYITFIKSRFAKIYYFFFAGVIFYFICKYAFAFYDHTTDPFTVDLLWRTILKLSLLSNITGNALDICGPWWFISVLFQLYFLYPLLIRLKSKQLLILMSVCWIAQLLVLHLSPYYIQRFMTNFPGHLPVFIAGILCLKTDIESVNIKAFTGALIVIVIGGFYSLCWVLIPVAVIIASIYIYKQIDPLMGKYTGRFLIFFGKNSIYFFLIHGFLRTPFVSIGNRSLLMSLVAAILFIACITGLGMIFKYTVNFIKNKITE